MLGKLLKYDLIYSLKKLSIMYGVVVLLSIYWRISEIIKGVGATNFKFDMGSGVSIFTVVFSGLLIFFGSFIVCIQRFWKNLFKGEGYLTFTLPVSPKLVLLSKILNYVCCIIIASILFLIICFIHGLNIRDFINALHIIKAEYIIQSFMLYFELIFGVFFLICTAITARFLVNKNKLLLSIGVYFGINLIKNLISSINVLLCYKQSLYDADTFLVIGFIVSLTFVIIESFIMCWIFKRKINLE